MLAALAALGLSWWGLRAEPRPARRAALLALRTITAALALFLLLEPAVQLLQTARSRLRFAVLVDTSRSMRFPVEPGGASRAEAVAGLLSRQRADLAGLAERVDLEVRGFSAESSPVDADAAARGLPADGSRTDLLGALRAAASGPGRKLAGVLLLSDGADNVALASGLTTATRAELKALGVPINTVAAGREPPRDLAVERVAAEEFAFVRSNVTIEATLRAHGLEAGPITVVLRREGSVVAQAIVKLEPGRDRYQVPLTFRPDTTGTFVFTVAAPVLPGEAVTANNQRSFVLRVIRDRVRVLLVAGRPSWDERFLRGLLKQDPNVDLVSFFILRTNSDQPGSQDQLSLIPFPVQEIFGPQLRTFDAVILLNFNYAPYRMLDIERFLPNLRDYVRGGGGLAMIGGEQGFGEARYGATPLAEVLPVVPLDGAGLVEERFRPRPTAQGRRHPITALGASEAATAAAWEALPPLEVLNRTRPLPPGSGAAVLLEAPGLLVDGQPAPVVAVREAGAGRTLAVTTDGSWHWGYLAAEGGGGDGAYRRFWSSALRWLVRDPELSALKAEPDAPVVDPGGPIGLSVSLRGADQGPAAGRKVAVELVAEDGRAVARSEAVTGADGSARIELPAVPPGAYKVQARAEPVPGGAPETSATALTVRGAGPEDGDATPRPELMAAIAELTGGDSNSLPGGKLPALRQLEPEVVEIGQRRDQPIWNRWWFLAGLCVSLGAEWMLRRRWGSW